MINGVAVIAKRPAGSTSLMSQYLMHRDKRFFCEPGRFNPERLNNEARTNLVRFSYFPFGGGPRACIGKPFALTEGTLAIAIIVRRWKMKLESGHPIALQPLVTLPQIWYAHEANTKKCVDLQIVYHKKTVDNYF